MKISWDHFDKVKSTLPKSQMCNNAFLYLGTMAVCSSAYTPCQAFFLHVNDTLISRSTPFPYTVLHRSIKTFFASRNKCYLTANLLEGAYKNTFIEVCKMIYVWHKKCSSAFASRKLSDFQKVKNQEISHARTKSDFCINNPYNVIVMPSTKRMTGHRLRQICLYFNAEKVGASSREVPL